MNTIENNKLIADFMGQGAQLHLVEHPQTGEYVDAEYHTSWDWLMPVVEKIGTVMPYNRHLDIDKLDIFTEFHIVYSAVIEFIEWYNENK